MDGEDEANAKRTKALLDTVSPSFCTVKWKHATLNLGAGAVKSCCHLPFRKFEAEHLENGHQFHDTKAEQSERTMMLKGERPKDCSLCWWVEDSGHISDRILWSSKHGMADHTRPLAKAGRSEAANPAWMELIFSNACNLRCSYCSPIFSSKWQQEIRDLGPYPTDPGHNDLDYLQGIELRDKFDNTELIEKFWPWFSSCYPDLRLLKMTGGEPLLSPQTFRMLEFVLNEPNRRMTLSVNSSLSVPEATWRRFLDLYARIRTGGAVNRLCLHPSIDTYGPRAEYIRFGLDFQVFKDRVLDYLEQSSGRLLFICTINNLCLSGLQDLWRFVLDLKQRFGPRGLWVSIASEVLFGPEWQNINILPESFQPFLIDTIDFVQQNRGADLMHFSSFELQQLRRALDLMKTPPQDLPRARRNFYKFFSEHDRRRGTRILEVFPEMREFWGLCQRMCDDV